MAKITYSKLNRFFFIRPGRISECLSHICSFKKNTVSFKLFGVRHVTPYKLPIYFNKLGCKVFPALINKSKEVCNLPHQMWYTTLSTRQSVLYMDNY